MYNFELEGSPLKCDLGRQATNFQHELGSGSSAFRVTYREWLGPKISESNILFPRNNFSLGFMLPWSLWAENIFSVFLEIFFRTENYPNYFQSFSANYFCSCFMLPWSLWAENIFRSRNYPSIYDFELEVPPLKCDLSRQASPLQLELGSKSSRYRRYVSRMTRTKNF